MSEKKRPGQKIKMISVDELLGVNNEESAIDIKIDEIIPFQNHPFKVLDDDKMEELVNSIRLNGILTPVISVGEEGNKLTNSNTISFRGKQRNNLAQFGSNFWAKENNGIIELEGDGLPIFTEVKKAVETYITKEIILDTNYNIKKLDNYEF